MRAVKQFDCLERFEIEGEASVHLAIGMFDGLHVGHKKVIESAIATADESGVCGVLTFWPHPSRLFNPGNPTRMISTPEIKRRELGNSNIYFEIEQPFSKEFAAVEADQFVKMLKDRIPKLASVHTGENWRFGKGRLGDAAMLQSLCRSEGIEARVVSCEMSGGERVSSTRIRSCLTVGDIGKANDLLGYPYYSIGTVVQGRRMGRTIDVPTLNLPFEGDLQPAFGVYAVYARDVASDKRFMGVANFGVKPTVGAERRPLLEAHLLEPCVFDYGNRLAVEWLKFLRPEEKFDSFDVLKAQIQKDIDDTKRYFGI
ncbi:MAG: riboflavin biosynthesis protein RibF, partial [Verrucomicrobiota bacterium]